MGAFFAAGLVSRLVPGIRPVAAASCGAATQLAAGTIGGPDHRIGHSWTLELRTGSGGFGMPVAIHKSRGIAAQNTAYRLVRGKRHRVGTAGPCDRTSAGDGSLEFQLYLRR